MAEDKPEGMSDQDWSNFQARYRPQATTPGAAPGAAPGPAPATPGVPGNVAPGLKNPSPSPTPALQPSPAPQVGLGNTVDGGWLRGTTTQVGTTMGPNAVTGGPLQADGGERSTQPSLETGRRVQGDGLYTAPNMPGGGQPQNPQQQMQAQLRTSIMGLLAPQGTPSVEDADVAPQSQAFRAAAERSQAARRAELVHQASRTGVEGAGGVETRLDSLSQQTGQAIGQNDANLLGQKQDARRQQLQFAIGQAQQLGMADEANNLQRQLANLGAQVETRGQDISREGLSLQNNLANLDASSRLYIADLNAQMQREGYSTQERLARMDSELRRYGIDVQGRLGELDTALRGQLGNRQLDLGYDQLGVDVARTRADYNRDAVRAGLEG